MDPRQAKRLVQEGYDTVSEAYRSDTGQGREDHDLLGWVERAVAGLPPGARVLDLGCGNGLPVVAHLARGGFVVTGVDLSPVQLRRAKRLVPAANFVLADMAALGVRPGSAEAVVALYSVLHLPPQEQPALLEDVGRWLVPGGRLLLVVGEKAWTGVEPFFGAPMYWGDAGSPAVEAWLADAGFHVVWRHREPEGSGAHVVLLAERSG